MDNKSELNQKEMYDVDTDYFAERAKKLVGPDHPTLSPGQVEYIVKQCRELVRPRTDEERAKISAELDQRLQESIRRGKERSRAEFYRKYGNQQYAAAKPKKRFFGIMFGWWY